jgi:hypothetical protein
MVVTMHDLDCGVWDVAFETKVFNRYDTFDQIANKNLEDPSYAYLCYNLLDKTILTIITLIMKSPHIKILQHLLQKNMYVKMVNLA